MACSWDGTIAVVTFRTDEIGEQMSFKEMTVSPNSRLFLTFGKLKSEKKIEGNAGQILWILNA